MTKNPGRVAAGKRLAEWKKQKVPKQEEEKNNFAIHKIIGGFTILAGVCYLGYRLYKEYKPKEKQPAAKEKPTKEVEKQVSNQPDPFFMQ